MSESEPKTNLFDIRVASKVTDPTNLMPMDSANSNSSDNTQKTDASVENANTSTTPFKLAVEPRSSISGSSMDNDNSSRIEATDTSEDESFCGVACVTASSLDTSASSDFECSSPSLLSDINPHSQNRNSHFINNETNENLSSLSNNTQCPSNYDNDNSSVRDTIAIVSDNRCTDSNNGGTPNIRARSTDNKPTELDNVNDLSVMGSEHTHLSKITLRMNSDDGNSNKAIHGSMMVEPSSPYNANNSHSSMGTAAAEGVSAQNTQVADSAGGSRGYSNAEVSSYTEYSNTSVPSDATFNGASHIDEATPVTPSQSHTTYTPDTPRTSMATPLADAMRSPVISPRTDLSEGTGAPLPGGLHKKSTVYVREEEFNQYNRGNAAPISKLLQKKKKNLLKMTLVAAEDTNLFVTSNNVYVPPVPSFTPTTTSTLAPFDVYHHPRLPYSSKDVVTKITPWRYAERPSLQGTSWVRNLDHCIVHGLNNSSAQNVIPVSNARSVNSRGSKTSRRKQENFGTGSAMYTQYDELGRPIVIV